MELKLRLSYINKMQRQPKKAINASSIWLHLSFYSDNSHLYMICFVVDNVS